MNRFAGSAPRPGCSILDRLDTDMHKVFCGDDDADAIARGLGGISVPDGVLPWSDTCEVCGEPLDTGRVCGNEYTGHHEGVSA